MTSQTQRTEADYALAARMLLKLRKGYDIRPAAIHHAREQFRDGTLDQDWKLDRALDILIDELEGARAEP